MVYEGNVASYKIDKDLLRRRLLDGGVDVHQSEKIINIIIDVDFYLSTNYKWM